MSCEEMLMFLVDDIEECRGLISNMKEEVIVKRCYLVSVIHTEHRIRIIQGKHAMHLLLKLSFRAEGAEDDGTFQILSCGACPVCSPADPPSHSPLQPHDDSTSAALQGGFQLIQFSDDCFDC